ncbi:hypothetical protein B1C78_02650 [Thioalkalivibrio denitrificans]|uniref:Uncharacterized protein n=1 Tax=Thioalkalivibrio denitrificans TaxID=108003 RepID=A0A1V3NS16_9GAMM|nr:hypothetical protein [Thioalkalivibrio denitrificans]OOG27887.1 hypothetical protein B1C78_02650 [Thioalkalivibrio denitrificans]
MKSAIRQIKPQADAATVTLATVTAAHEGEATAVQPHGTEAPLPVAAHASHVPPLEPGDQVIVASTAEGLVMISRLRRPGERPSQGFSVNEDGSLSVASDRGITIRTARAAIELRADGRLCVDGREIYAVADGLHRLQGATIELN